MRSESEIGAKSAMGEQLKAQVEDLKLQLSQNDTKLAEYQSERVSLKYSRLILTSKFRKL